MDRKKKVFVVGGDLLIERMFEEHGWEVTNKKFDADLYCFTGGSDVTPALYGQENVASGNNIARDAEESALYDELVAVGAPMVGICRGAQFLNVMNGGTMWQDVDNHTLGGTHEMKLLKDGKPVGTFRVTSTHHQMMRPDIDGELLGVAEGRATYKRDDQGTIRNNDKKFNKWDTEIVYYENTDCLCFQPHPEYGNSPQPTTQLFFDLIEEYLYT